VVGATDRGNRGLPCNDGGLHIVDIRDPQDPTFAGCFDDDGYTHDVQCVIYHGPDVRYQGREICFASNPDPPLPGRLTVVDVTDKSDPVLLSRTPQGAPYSYSHQGWLTEDHRYFLHDDESDEITNPGRTRTRIFDVTDLEDVFVQAVYHSPTRAADHNLYVKGRYAYLTNYFDGLRVVDITKIDFPGNSFAPDTPELIDHQGLFEAACFDTDPVRNDVAGFGGVWSNYPWFKNNIVAVSGFEGLWILRTRLGSEAAFPPGPTQTPPAGNREPRDVCL
jgi:choice-of-anchor B domain-containing protein